ncbi:MAG: PQQ-binding-like beta-propeller repeat protein, partial [Planctomycetota bacterium]
MFFVTAICCSPVVAENWPVSRGDTAATGVSETVLPDSLDVRWKYVAPDSPFEAEPVVAGGIVYIGDADGTVHAIRLDDGEGVWKKQFAESGFTAAGAIANQRFYVGDIYGVVRCLLI